MSLAYSQLMSGARARRRAHREIGRQRKLEQVIERLRREHPTWSGAALRVEARRQVGGRQPSGKIRNGA